jgi:nanoRNase/pAp phosphatase (c-di-AMP/oligoRNAs hydrolase)
VSAEPEGTRRDRPLLIVVSDSAELTARVRSPSREVCRWRPDAVAGAGDGFGGDPTDSACYSWVREARAVTAVIDLEPAGRARAALAAVRAVRPDAAVLVLSDDVADLDGAGDGTVARAGELRDVLRLDLDDELHRLEAERRVHCLRTFAAGDDVVPILIHQDPDPDAVSSACAVAAILGGRPDRNPIVTFSEIMRPENRRMVELLRIRVTRITREELRGFERVITVDMQPVGLQIEDRPRFAVIDHHPLEDGYSAAFADIRPEYGATASLITEYLRAVVATHVGRVLATALLFGIRTDTGSLTRAVTPADVEAYAFLQQNADLQLIRRLQRPSYPIETARAFGAALSTAEYDEDLCVCFLGELHPEEPHVLADVADFCLGIENVTRVVVAAILDDSVVLTLRYAGTGANAGDLARALVVDGGSGGGHASMARVVLPLERAYQLLGTSRADDMTRAIRDLIRAQLAELEPA